MNQKDLHITVAAIPDIDYGNSRILDHDLRLTKASILYADRVKLCSISTWMATSIFLLGHIPQDEAQQLEVIIGLISAMAENKPEIKNKLSELQKDYQLLKRNPITLSRKEREKKSDIKKKLPEMWEPLRESFGGIPGSFGFDEIELAANERLLEIHPFSSAVNESFPEEYMSLVEDLLASSTTHPMLDEQTSDLVRLALEEGKISIRNSNTRKSKQVGLVADLFDRLPIFDVRMDELLDLRDELKNPLRRFRAEIVTLGNDIETAVWDKDFASDVQEIYQAKVEPTLIEIEEKLKSPPFKEFWSQRIVDKADFLTAATGCIICYGGSYSPLGRTCYCTCCRHYF